MNFETNGRHPTGVLPFLEQSSGLAPMKQRLRGESDSARFAHVVLPHLTDAYALARWLTGNKSDAKDVVQEACLGAFRGIGRFSDGNARAWVLTIVRNTAYSWLGKNRPATVVITDDLESVERADPHQGRTMEVETPETALIAKADAERLKAAIADLPPTFRETLVLRDLQGLDYREIARVTRVARARERLIAIIAQNTA
jgi:RNA polymerase sigma-70 factor (ECF subfamily)